MVTLMLMGVSGLVGTLLGARLLPDIDAMMTTVQERIRGGGSTC